jgi:DNA end-binding protein Ku
VIVSSEELEALDPKKTKTIDIEEFVDLSDIDPLYYDHPYYLLPGQGAAKPYKLLVDAMADAGKVAIARVVIRTKEQLVAIRPHDGVLAMATMNFADEVVDPDSFDETPGEDVDTTKRELDMARQLIDSLTAQFDPEKYHDEYREAVLDLIERKADGEEVVLQPAAEEPEKVPDLMAALEASLAAAKKEDGGSRPRKRGAADGAGAKKQPARRGGPAKSKSKSKSKS